MGLLDLFVLLTSVLLFAAADPSAASAHSNETSSSTSELNNAAAKGLHGADAANGRVQEERVAFPGTAPDVFLGVARSRGMTGIAEKLKNVETIDGAFKAMKLQNKVAAGIKLDTDYVSLAREVFDTNDFLAVYDHVHKLYQKRTNAEIVDHLQTLFGPKPLAMLLQHAKQFEDGRVKDIAVELEKAQFAKWLNVEGDAEVVAKVHLGIYDLKDPGLKDAVKKDIFDAYSEYAKIQKSEKEPPVGGMNSPSACDACGKKFNVFSIKKKCKHCTDIVCKACLATHLELKHTYAKRSPRDGRQRASVESSNVTNDHQQGNPQMLPPFRSPTSELEDRDSDLLKDVDAMEAKSEEDDVDDDDDDDVEDAKVLGATLSRQSPAEEKKSFYRELQLIQRAVATWTLKEMRAKQAMEHTKETSYCRDMTEVFPKMCSGDELPCRVVVVSYAVTLTLAVWTIFGLLLTVYLGPARINSSYALPGCNFFADT